MPVRFRNYIKFLIATCLVVSFCLIEADAQTRRKRTRRSPRPAVPRPVITNPPIAPPDGTVDPATGDVKIISTADSAQDPDSATEPNKARTATPGNPDQPDVQQTITTLSTQVNKLNDKLTSMQEDDKDQRDMERLTRAEQRAEQLRSQLMDVQSKIADFEAKLEQIDFALKPENLESAAAGYGSTRPEAIRDMRKKQLEGEKSRVTTQLKLAETSKSRLEIASQNADAEVDLMRAKLQQRRAQEDAEPLTGEAPPKPPRKPE